MDSKDCQVTTFVFYLKINFFFRLIVVGSYINRTGALQIFEMNSGKLELVSESEKGSPLKCCTTDCFGDFERQVVTGAFDGRVMIFDLNKMELPLWSAKGHSEFIHCIDGARGDAASPSEFATGSKDGTVKLWDPRIKDEICSFESDDPLVKPEVWAVAFGNNSNSNWIMM